MKTRRSIFAAGLLILALMASSCAAHRREYDDGLRAYNLGRYSAAAKKMAPLKKYANDFNYPIYMLDLGYASEMSGNLNDAKEYYLAGLAAMEQRLDKSLAAVQVLSPGEIKFYRGDQYEHVFTHVFLGRVFFRLGQYNDARIEFRQALEQDISSSPKTEQDAAAAHFLLGETYMRLDDSDQAAVAYRNVVKFQPDFPYSYLELARIEKAGGNDGEAGRYYKQYLARDRSPEKFKLDDDGRKTGTLVVMADLGDGPYRVGNEFNQKIGALYPERTATVSVGGRALATYKLDEVLPHAQHEAGRVVHSAKEIGATVARKALEIWAENKTGVRVEFNDDDRRRFDLMPGEFHVAEIPLPPGTYNPQVFLIANDRSRVANPAAGAVRIKAGEKTYLFVRCWTGWHPPPLPTKPPVSVSVHGDGTKSKRKR